jgi:predicted RNase H-like HicB family nuclease
MMYAIVIERAGANFSAYVPELEGCVATAATQKEVETLLREAIELDIAGMREDNQPIPQPSSRVEYLEVEVAAM